MLTHSKPFIALMMKSVIVRFGLCGKMIVRNLPLNINFYHEFIKWSSTGMAEQYWVGDFFVDATRNQITQKSQSQSIPPKALAVLTCLAKNANKVVTHDEILSQVWPDTIVTPNTLQRSIAQLRKVLNESNSTGENSRSYIKTHAKQGYSLEVEVKWQSAVSDTPDDAIVTTDKPTIEKTLKSPLTLVAIVLALITCTFIGLYISMSTSDLKLNIAEFNSLTATDHKEYSPIYTPDGQYVVFQRYSDKVCRNNNIWAKNTKTQEEFQLTKNMGAYGSHSFSIDGQKLVFIESNNCDKPINQKLCYQLMSMDFQKALKQPQSPTVLVECKSTKIARPKWLNNNNIALIHTFADRRQLISYSIIENKSTVFYELEEGDIVHFDYSAKDELIAIIRVHSDEQLYLDMVRFDGEVLSSHEIVLPDEIFGNRFIYPNFTPYASKLIFSTGRRLFTLSYQGEVSNISLPLNEAISSPIFHPSGKRMLVIKGHYDSDIALMSLTSMMSDDSYSILMRSTKGEDNAQFQPQGELIAFTSAKSGKSQLWITDGKSTQQLSDFPIDSFLYGLDWAVDGQSILVNVNKRLTRIFLEPRTVAVPFAHPVEQLFQWSLSLIHI